MFHMIKVMKYFGYNAAADDDDGDDDGDDDDDSTVGSRTSQHGSGRRIESETNKLLLSHNFASITNLNNPQPRPNSHNRKKSFELDIS